MRVLQTEEKGQKDIVIIVNRDEAIGIIKSLSTQMAKRSSNTGREEFLTEDEEYFTIAVKDKK